MAHLVMLVIFHMNAITCQNFNLPHIFCIVVEKKSFFNTKIFKLTTWYLNMVQIM
jgi:hypothetical protein